MAHWTDEIGGTIGGKPCPCGSGNLREDVYDARGIFVAFVCDDCRRRKLQGFRPEIFSNAQYEAPDLGEDDT